MRGLVAALGAVWLLGCSTDTFVGDDASSDAAGDATALDAAPPLDAGKADAVCPPNADVACASGCATLGACCITPDAATCAAACTGVELDCMSQAECTSTATTCCLGNIGKLGGCPVSVGGNGTALRAKCALSCGATGDAKVCKLGSSECGTGSTCVPVVIDINPSVKIGLCTN